MTELSETGVTRRSWLLGAGAATALMGLLGRGGEALAQEAGNWEEALRRITGGTRPLPGKLALDLPEIAESGNTVPFSVAVESPMTEAEHVRRIHVLSTGNPQPVIAGFQFTPAAGRAAVAGRLRLAKSQDVVAVAELSDGKFLLARRMVKVTIGGCGG